MRAFTSGRLPRSPNLNRPVVTTHGGAATALTGGIFCGALAGLTLFTGDGPELVAREGCDGRYRTTRGDGTAPNVSGAVAACVRDA